MPQTTSAITDAEGKFRVTGLPAGTYFVTLRRTGFISSFGATAGSATNVVLTAGQELKGLRYLLKPQAVLAGRVLDDEDEPVQNAQVLYITQRRFRGSRSWVPAGRNATTNDRGEFRLTEVPPGTYRILVMFWGQAPAAPATPGQPAMGYVLSYYPGVTDITQAAPVEAAAGAETNGLDITLRRMPIFQIRGKVFDADGKPARQYGAAVVPQEGAFGGVGRFSRSGDDGSFAIAGVPNGTWTLHFSTQGTGPRREEGRQAARTKVEISGRDIEGLEIHLNRGVALQGTISVATTGKATQEEKPTLYVTATPAEPSGFGGAMPVKAEPDGSFALKLAEPGRYFLSAYATAGASLYLDSVKVGGEEYYGRAVELGAGASPALTFVLRADGGKITGTLDTGDGDKPAGNTMVLLMPADPALRGSLAGRNTRPADQNGAFTFENIRPGEYLVAAGIGSDPNALMELEDARDFDSKAQKVKVTAGGSASVQLKPIVLPDH